MADKKLTTEDALDILTPSEDGTSTEDAIDAVEKNLAVNSGVSEEEIEAIEKKTNRLRAREGHLLRLDRLFLSKGVHLSLTLPVFALILQLISRRFARGSPDWWISSVESSFEYATLTRTSGMLAVVVLSAWVVTLLVVRSLHRTTRRVFESERDAFMLRGRPFESLHGFEAIHDVTKNAINRVSAVLSVVFIGKFAKKPMHLFGAIGMLMFIIGFGFSFYLIMDKVFIDQTGKLLSRRTEFFIALTSMIIGVQFFLAGFVAELIGRNSSQRNVYIVEKFLDVD